MFDVLAAALTRRRRVVLVLVGVMMALAGLLSLDLQSRLSSGWSDFDDPGAANVAARTVIEQATGIDPQQGYVLLVHTDQPLDPATSPPAVRAVVDLLRARPEVREVLDYATDRLPALISTDGHSTAVYARTGSVVEKDVVPELEAQIRSDPSLAGRVQIGGPTAGNVQIASVVVDDLEFAEMVVFPALFVLLIVVFRGVVAALLPLAGGAVTVLAAMAAMRGILEVTALSVYSLNLVLALGLGLSIDFSLLIVSRYREQIPRTGTGPDTLRHTLNTAGRTVLFSGLTIASALMALLAFPQRQLHSMGIAGILVTAAALLYALVILPAILAVLGHRIESWAPQRWQRRTWDADTPDPAAVRWRRVAQRVMARPRLFATCAAVLLIVLAAPLLGVKFTGVQSATVLPDSVSAGAVARSLADDFTTSIADQEHLVLDAPPGASGAVTDYAARLAGVDGVTAVTPPRPLDTGHWLVSITLAGQPISAPSQTTMRAVEGIDAGYPVHATGPTADVFALDTSLADHLPSAVLVLVAATLVMLFAMTGSVVLPVKAVAMNVLSLGASLGIVTMVFQHGTGAPLFGATGQGALESTSPIILGAVAFGLSTDYGVFLLGRIKEFRDNGTANRESVAGGIEHTGRIVTSAAALFCLAMSALLFSRLVFIKELGLGAALAVLLDATIVRAVLVPALMTVLGARNWWAPAPLRRLHATWPRPHRSTPTSNDSAPLPAESPSQAAAFTYSEPDSKAREIAAHPTATERRGSK